MAVSNPKGFTPSGHLHGVVSHRQRLISTGGRNNHTLMVGDCVHLDSSAGGFPQKWPAGTFSAAHTRPVGVIVGLYDSNKRPLTHYQPGRNPVIAPNTSAYVAVVDDPNVVYTVEWEASFGASNYGSIFIGTTANAGVTALGRSGMRFTADTTSSASLSHPFMVLGLSGGEDDTITSGASAFNDIEVIIAAHQFRSNIV